MAEGGPPRRLLQEPARRALHIALADISVRHGVSVMDMCELLAEKQAELIGFAQRRPRLAFTRDRPSSAAGRNDPGH